MLIMKLIFIILFLLIIYYFVGNILTIKLPHLKGFELLVGYLMVFSVFHVLSVIPTVLNTSVEYIYTITYPIIGIFIIISSIYTIKRLEHKINYFLLLTIVFFIGLFFLFDFILIGDSSFYLSLIRSITTRNTIYSFEPWSGTNGFIGYMYYFVTYEVYIGSLSKLFQIDSTIFTINVMTTVHLVLVLSTTYTFLSKILKNNLKTKQAFLLYLVILIFLNSNLHRVFFTHNAFNLITLPYSGKMIYLNGVVVFLFYLVNRIILYKNKSDIILLGALNLIVPGLTASALYLQLILSIIILVYFMIYKHDKSNRFYGFLILTLFIPIIFNYQFILLAPSFYLSSNLILIIIESLFVLIIGIGIFLLSYKKPIFIIHHKFITIIFYTSLVILGIISLSSGIYFLIKRSNEVNAAFGLLPNIIDIIYLYGYHLLVFYILSIISIFTVHKIFPQYKFIFYYYFGIMILLFLNPFNYPIVGSLITSFATYHRIVYLLPLHLMIVLYLMKIKNRKIIIIWIIAIIVPFTTIFHGLNPINTGEINFYYKVPQDIVSLGKKLDKPYRIIAEESILGELPIVTNNYNFVFTILNLRQVEYNTYKNDELYNLYEMINNKNQFMAHTFTDLVKKYDIQCIIIHENNPIVDELKQLYQKSETLSTESIIVYLIQ